VDDLRLEPLGEQHLTGLDGMLRDPLVLRFTPVPDPVPDDQARTMLQAYAEDDTREGYAAVDADGGFVGLAVVVRIDRTAEECELGYMVAPAHRGRGAATQMLRLLSERALLGLDMKRVVLRISADNAASERVAERNGFRREGLLRSTYVKPGVRCDTALWSRLPGDDVS
jgi:RimJ/RimL family protein N-acetyltransferase